MVLIYVDEATRDKLKERAREENRTVAAILRIFACGEETVRAVDADIDSSANTVDARAVLIENLQRLTKKDAGNLAGEHWASEKPTDPEKRWEWVKRNLGLDCGCVFDDDLFVIEVKDWGLFRTISNGKLMEIYLSMNPKERDMYSGVTAEQHSIVVKEDEAPDA